MRHLFHSTSARRYFTCRTGAATLAEYQQSRDLTYQTNDTKTSFKKVPALSAESNYAQFGSWKTDLGAYLSRNDMQLWSTLDEDK